MLNGDERREKILEILGKSTEPVSGTALSKLLGVSRQIVVQDVALIRAVNKNIMATNKGYILYTEKETDKSRRTLCLKHTNEQMSDELNTIVDLGGKVLDVVVDHEIYGQIMVDLIINNRHDVEDFIKKVEKGGASPLNALTNGVHYHTITAESEETLNAIEDKLRKKGYIYNA